MVVDDKLNDLKPIFEKLASYRDQEGRSLTQQAMADRLNADGVLSRTGQPWSKYSVRRLLKSLTLQAMIPGGKQIQGNTSDSRPAGTAIDDDEIRSRIKQGLYDTATERFVAQAIATPDKKNKEKKDQGVSKEQTKKEKSKNKKKKGKK